MRVWLGLAVAAAFAAGPAAGKAPARHVRVADGYRLFGERYSWIMCEVPEKWSLQLFPKPDKTGERQLFVSSSGRESSLTAYYYDGKHPEYSTMDRYLESVADGVPTKQIQVGRNHRVAKQFERSTARGRHLVVVIPSGKAPRFYVIRYSGVPKAFERDRPKLQHLLDTWLFRRKSLGTGS